MYKIQKKTHLELFVVPPSLLTRAAIVLLTQIFTPVVASSIQEGQARIQTEFYSDQEAINNSSGISSASTRYIDYQDGDDNNTGTRDAPWKHHPWDVSAKFKAKATRGVNTYIFKKGVTYRGFMNTIESGNVDAPIVLTIDPEWGKGDAILAGSIALSGGWKPCKPKVTRNLPDASKKSAWCQEIATDYEPQLLWEVGDTGVSRIPIARSPNWRIFDWDDPRSEWYEVENVTMEFPVFVDDVSGFSVGDNLYIRSDMSTSLRSNVGTSNSLKLIGISENQLRVKANQDKTPQSPSGSIITNGREKTRIKSIGNSHSIVRTMVDGKNLNATEKGAYTGATIWAERRSMPKADAAIITGSSENERSVRANFHRTFNAGPMQYDRYYLEGLPGFLDSAGEFIYQKTGNNSGLLILRLPGDRDPNRSIIEAASLPVMLQIKNHSNIKISGLSFRFSNQIPPGTSQARHASLYASPIQIRGDASNITISNCNFSYLPAGVVAFPEERKLPSVLDNIAIVDNVFSEIDGTPIALGNGQSHYELKKNGSRLIHVDVIGNVFERMGYRTLGNFGVGSHGDGIHVMGGEVVEVAGNQIRQVWGSGISVTLGSEYQHGKVARPFLRSLIHDNTVIDSLLGAQDGGGINSWMGGPSYIYNNISGNPVGCMYSRYKTSTRKDWYRRGCYGVGIYLDGQYKAYVFNNIVWGKNNNVNDRIYNSVALNEAMGFMNTVFQNTFYRFGTGLHKGMFQHNRNYYLGNLFIDMGLSYIDQEPLEDSIEFSTLAFTHNQFFGQVAWFGKLGTRNNSRPKNIESWRNTLRRAEVMSYDTGAVITSNPVRDAARHDFRPVDKSPVINQGVRVFVPWALYDVVGEWHFFGRNEDPTLINGENISMDSRWLKRDMFHRIPRNDLRCVNTDITDFENGILEDWIAGSLRFDGETRYCTFSKTAFDDSPRDQPDGDSDDAGNYPDPVDMDENNFLIETVIATEPGAGPAGLVQKLGRRGYSLQINAGGHVELVLDYGADTSQRTSSRRVDDSRWHHVLVEVDRNAKEGIAIYIDGRLANGDWSGSPMKTASLSNTEEFVVGRSSDGLFRGNIDFLRLSRGTLVQAETDIDELYGWEFAGPQLYDFYGFISGDARDVGAVEYCPGYD